MKLFSTLSLLWSAQSTHKHSHTNTNWNLNLDENTLWIRHFIRNNNQNDDNIRTESADAEQHRHISCVRVCIRLSFLFFLTPIWLRWCSLDDIFSWAILPSLCNSIQSRWRNDEHRYDVEVNPHWQRKYVHTDERTFCIYCLCHFEATYKKKFVRCRMTSVCVFCIQICSHDIFESNFHFQWPVLMKFEYISNFMNRMKWIIQIAAVFSSLVSLFIVCYHCLAPNWEWKKDICVTVI